jgi:ribosomal peptide maturation radical SAM protein 1
LTDQDIIRGHAGEDTVLLLSTPWPLYNRPSIQLGALKAFLRGENPGLKVDAHHFYLQLANAIGYERYQEISKRSWLAETIYAAILFPELFEKTETLFDREAPRGSKLRSQGLKSLSRQVQEASETFIEALNLKECLLAGLSVSLCQLTSALYFAREIKRRSPETVVVVGGSTFGWTTADGLLDYFSPIDLLVMGEGEVPLTRIVGHLCSGGSLDDLPQMPGVLSRKSVAAKPPLSPFSQLVSLEALPTPDYDDYFGLLERFDPQNRFFPTIPVETSRGCWWHGREPGSPRGCAFCNLNLQWSGYRSKGSSKSVSEVDDLTQRHRTLSVAIVDNVLPKSGMMDFFKGLTQLGKDFNMFCELRADTPPETLKAMREAGVREVQIGVEAISTGLLKRLKKGTTAIQNLERMKWCEALGIVNLSNLIVCFPGSDESDVQETLTNIPFAYPFRPPTVVPFWLGLGSHVWRNHTTYGLKAVFNHPAYGRILPREIHQNVPLIHQAYRGDMALQKRMWKPVIQEVKAWQKRYNAAHANPFEGPILTYRDGGSFMIIRDRSSGAEALTHRLISVSRALYLFCERRRSLNQIKEAFPQIPLERITEFLDLMVKKRLMFMENDQYLSLAVRVGAKSL